MIERRRSQRKNVCFDAELVIGQTRYECTVENISLQGICIETDSSDPLATKSQFLPHADCELYFTTPEGDVINLRCQVMWSYQMAPSGLKRKSGMEIIFPPPEFVLFYNSEGHSKS